MHESPQLPQVDVIILSWNRPDDTLAAVTSARDQIDVDQRILIVDQGSEPAHLERLTELVATIPCATLRRLDRNIGVPAGRNLAASLGRAPVIVALDSDAVFADRGVLARAARRLAQQPELCAVAFAIINYFSGETDWSSWDYPRHYEPTREFLTTRFVGAGHAIRRSSFEAVGGYDPRLMFCGEELELCYRMINRGQRIVYDPSLAVLHKVASDHRIFWERGRYYQTVRNALYTLYKFGASWPRMLLAAGAFWLRGSRNGIVLQAVRGTFASIPMCWQFARSREDKALCRLSADTWRYIHECEPARREPWRAKLRRQLALLPAQGRSRRRLTKLS